MNKNEGIALFSGTIHGLFGKLFEKGKFNEIKDLYSKLKSKFKNKFYIEVQRHGDLNEKNFEHFNLKISNELKEIDDWQDLWWVWWNLL